VSAEFRTTAGVRQGDILSPYLVIILMDDIMKDCKQRTRDFIMGNWKMCPVRISEVAFANDVAPIAKTEQNLQFNLDVWQQEMSRRDMDINKQKTKTMVITRNPVQHTIGLVGQQLEQVESLKYLGAFISQDGRIDLEVNNRIPVAGRLYHAISRGFTGNREVSEKTKLTVYRTVYLPTLDLKVQSRGH
jgi:hypothetical protein